MQPVWINALIGRIFWDFLCEKYWSDQVAHKIQCKLSKIRVGQNKKLQIPIKINQVALQISQLFYPALYHLCTTVALLHG